MLYQLNILGCLAIFVELKSKGSKFIMLNVYIAALLVFFAISIPAHADWQAQTSGVTDNLNSVFFVDENTGWAVGVGGRIITTTNGGSLWAQQVSNTASSLNSVFFTSALTGYAAGAAGVICKTTNGGASWQSSNVTGVAVITEISFANVSTGYLCGSNTGGDGIAAVTTNAGSTWQVVIVTAVGLNCLYAVNGTTAYTAGISGLVFRTTNGGANWVQQTTPSTNFVSSIVFPDPSNGYFTTLGITEQVYRSTNSGSNWTEVTSPGNTSGLNSLFALDPSTLYGVGTAGTIRRTTNSGSTWETQPSPVSVFFNSIFMVNSNVGYIVGNTGTILKTVNGGIGIQQISTNVPAGYRLEQNYPNPFNPVTNIEFSIPKSGHVKLSVFDINGKLVTILADQNLSLGTYNADFDAAYLSTGVYFYTLETNSFIQTKRMILVK